MKESVISNEWTKDDYSIGEVSEIFGISSKMLRYWDSIGLLKPNSVDQINGYRYYSSSHFYLINFIRYLRKLGVPYNKIKAQLNDTNIESFEELLREQIKETENRVKELINIKKAFTSHIADIEQAHQSSDVDKVIIKQLPERKIVMLEYPISNRKEFEMAIRKLEIILTGSPTLLVSQVAAVIGQEDLHNGCYCRFIGVSMPHGIFKVNSKYVVTRPEGEYAILRFWGHLKNSDKYYAQLVSYIREHGYKICGDLVRRCLSPGTIAGRHDHLAEICIPIEKNQIN